VKPRIRAVLSITIYLFLILAPLLLLLIGERPEGREFWREFAVALGFAGLSLMGLQFLPTARLPFLASIFSTEALYYVHHRISMLAFGLIVAHPTILLINNPDTYRLFNVFDAPSWVRPGIISVFAVAGLALSSVYRKQWAMKYEAWRILHNLLTLVAVTLSLRHIFGVGYYLSIPLQRVVWIAMALLWLSLLAYIRIIKPWIMLRHPYRLKELIKERGDSWTLVIEPVGHEGLSFMPGQFAWLTIGTSPFAIREHPFAMSSSAEHPQRLEFTIKELGDFTSTINGLPPGERVYVDGPYGTFSIDRCEASGYVFIAGGIGITPMMSMMRTLTDRGDERPVLLFYGNVTWDSVAFRDEIEALTQRLNLQVVHTLEESQEGVGAETGFITKEVLDRHLPGNRHALEYFICGPILMLDAVEDALADLDVPLPRMHSSRHEMA